MGKCECCGRTYMLCGDKVCAYCLQDMREAHGTKWEHTPENCWRKQQEGKS